jgi:NAD+ diphosphatase
MPFIPSFTPRSAATAALCFAIGKRGLLTRHGGGAPIIPTLEEVRGIGIDVESAFCFGCTAYHQDTFALAVPDDLRAPSGWSLLNLRALAQAFDGETFALAGRAAHVLDWATTSRFCGRCGGKTERVPTEWGMKCPSCGLTMYPRIAPAVIVLVRRGPLALLAKNARFPLPFYSTLAGFSDIGETLEETLRREVLEEVGIRIKGFRYFGSQPWPFPHSLMIAFMAEWESGEIKVDEEEIVDAKWVSADALPMIPPPISIARRLIDAWIAEVAPGQQPG